MTHATVCPTQAIFGLSGSFAFAFSLWRVSFARNFAMPSINFAETGAESGKRIVPCLISYRASSSAVFISLLLWVDSNIGRIPRGHETRLDGELLVLLCCGTALLLDLCILGLGNEGVKPWIIAHGLQVLIVGHR